MQNIMNKKNKVILVTGGAGFIGSHTAVELINNGYDVVIVDNLSNSQPSVISALESIVGKPIKFFNTDCCDTDSMQELFDSYDFAAVIHFAASKAVGESVHEPLKYYRNNINSLLVIMEQMARRGVANLIFSSSCTVYGQPDILPVTELTPRQEATSPYGNTKQINEDMIRDLMIAQSGKMKAIALRYFNPIGAHPSAMIGEMPIGVPSNLIPYLTQTAAGLRDCLSVYGDDYDTADGSAIRDYINIMDLAAAHVCAVDRLIEGNNKSDYEYFNIGTGNGVSVLELIHSFERATGVKVNYKIVGRRDGDIAKIWADASKAKNELGWQATRSLDETLLSAWNWQKHIMQIESNDL